jgi:hypothetical protein
MKPEFNIENCKFNDEASVIRTYNDYSLMNVYVNDIEAARSATTDEKILEALEQLQVAVQTNSKPSIAKVVSEFATQFSSNLFASIASAGLLALVKGFLP